MFPKRFTLRNLRHFAPHYFPKFYMENLSAKGITITTYNVEWFFENNNNVPFIRIRDYKEKSTELADVIALEKPDVLGLQEVSSPFVLDKLVEDLSTRHHLRYHAYCGRNVSKRTFQTVGLLVRACEEVRVEDVNSFAYEKSLEEVLPHISPLTCRKERAVLCTKATELLRKNIYATIRFDGKRILVLNFHLKANFDSDSTAVRELEAVLLQALVRNLTSLARENGKPFDSVVMVGDYNDFDRSFPAAFPAQCESTVVERIRSGRDLLTAEESGDTTLRTIAFENALTLIEPIDARESAIYHILIDHILYANLTSDATDGRAIKAKSCRIQHRRDDCEEGKRTSDHWPVTAVFAFE